MSLPKTYDPLEVTLDEAIELILAKREAEAKKHIKKFDEDAEMETSTADTDHTSLTKEITTKYPKTWYRSI